MSFNSYTYLLFLILVISIYGPSRIRGRQLLFLVASYVFYCWETAAYGWLLFGSTFLDYTVARCMAPVENQRIRKAWLGLSILGNLGVLCLFKYLDFFGHNIMGLAQWIGVDSQWRELGWVLPVGISFYTFQSMSYTIEVYRKKIQPEKDIIQVATYVAFFPQLVAGPIERADRLLPQLAKPGGLNIDDIGMGLTRIAFGLFRKLVIADRIALYVNVVYNDPSRFTTGELWLAALLFLVQIYHDFAGYSDMAIGSARLFGIHLMENFKLPLIAPTIGAFWNRWHISLSTWFRDYLFLPLGGFRKGGQRAALNAMIVFALCGLWHGAEWHYVSWGVYHGFALPIYVAWRSWRRKRKKKKGINASAPGAFKGIAWLTLCILTTYLVNVFGCVFFRSPDLPTAWYVFSRLPFPSDLDPVFSPLAIMGLLGILAGSMLVDVLTEYGNLIDRWNRLPVWIRAAFVTCIFALTAVTAVNHAEPYIYFQF